MFTGIIENTGTVEEIIQTGSNLTFWINSPISDQLKVDQSVAHNGVCLTVEEIRSTSHRVTAILETLEKTNLQKLQLKDRVNLERCLQINGRLDGHMVQGHVDSTAICTNMIEQDGSWLYEFQIPEKFAGYIVEKGSIAVNGISLTLFNATRSSFTVAIIPYTFANTNLQDVKKGTTVNLEFDIIGKYILRNQQLQTLT